jgi:glutaredoxin
MSAAMAGLELHRISPELQAVLVNKDDRSAREAAERREYSVMPQLEENDDVGNLKEAFVEDDEEPELNCFCGSNPAN